MDTYIFKKPVILRTSQVSAFVAGLRKVVSDLSNLRPEDIGIIKKTFSNVLISLYLILRKKQKQNGKKKLYIAELVPENNWKIWKDKKNILEINTLSIALLQTSAAVLIGNEKVCKPFWNGLCEEKSRKLWLPIKTDCQDFVLNSSNGSVTRTIQRSLLTEQKNTEQQNKSSPKTSYQSLLSTPANKWEKEDIRTKKIRLKPNLKSRMIIKEWLETSRAVYNKGVDELSNDKKKSFYSLRNKLVTHKTKDGKINPNVPNWMLNTPKDVRAGALQDLVTSFKGNVTKLKKGMINFFCLKHRQKKSVSQVITIPKNAIKLGNGNVKIYETYIKENIKHTEKKKIIITSDCKLEYHYPNRYYLIIPYVKKFKQYEKEKDIIALDPGIRKFMTSYSEDEICKFEISKKIDKLNKEIDDAKSKNKSRKAILKREHKIKNIVKEFHYEVINYLTKNYKRVFLPSFDSQEFFGKKTRVINKISARKLNNLSHYKFKQRLLDRCKLTNTELYIVDESYTSKTCGRCGKLNDIGGKEKYECSFCSLKIDRDVNGARNIFIKNIK